MCTWCTYVACYTLGHNVSGENGLFSIITVTYTSICQLGSVPLTFAVVGTHAGQQNLYIISIIIICDEWTGM